MVYNMHAQNAAVWSMVYLNVCFQVPFLRTWFAQNHVDAFSVSLWYKRLGGSDALYGALVNNEDCLQNPGFSLRAKEGAMLLSKIRTDMNEETLSGAI